MDPKEHLTSVLKALELNNAIPPEERAKRKSFAEEQAAESEASLIKPLRTFESDAADYIHDKKQSIYSISEAEKEKRKKEEKTASLKKPKKHFGIFIVSALCLIFICSGIAYSLVLNKKETPPTETAAVSDSIIPNQSEYEIKNPSTNVGSIAQAIKNIPDQASLSEDDVENIKIIENGNALDISDILTNFSPSAPTSLLRSFDPENYMLGFIEKGTKQPFFIIKVNYYENAFAGMLNWENNIGNIFSGIESTSSIPSGNFSDAIVENKNVRALHDSQGNTIVLYSFFDSNTLIITTNEIAFAEIVKDLEKQNSQ